MINIVPIISIYIWNGSIYYILLISSMQSEDSPEKSFQAEMSAIVSAFARDFPNKLQSASQRKLILESVSYLLRNEGRMQELIEYDINKSPSRSLSLASQSQQESEEAPASHHNQSKGISKNKIRMIDLSEHYEDSIFKHSHASSYSSDEQDMETTLLPNTKDEKTMAGKLTLRRTEMVRKSRDLDHMIKIEESPPNYKYQSFSSDKESVEEESWAKKPAKKQRQSLGRRPEFPELQREIIAWIYSQISQGQRVTQLSIRKKAISMVKQLPRSKETEFKASKGWLHKFLRRHSDIYGLLSQQIRKKQTRNMQRIFEELVSDF